MASSRNIDRDTEIDMDVNVDMEVDIDIDRDIDRDRDMDGLRKEHTLNHIRDSYTIQGRLRGSPASPPPCCQPKTSVGFQILSS